MISEGLGESHKLVEVQAPSGSGCILADETAAFGCPNVTALSGGRSTSAELYSDCILQLVGFWTLAAFQLFPPFFLDPLLAANAPNHKSYTHHPYLTASHASDIQSNLFTGSRRILD
jgi:hypothetical protein